jgi:hypothetical protein
MSELGQSRPVRHPGLWCLLFGCIYFAVRGVWTHAVASALLAIVTVGISWAARMLLDGGPPQHIVLPVELVVRGSTASPRQ